MPSLTAGMPLRITSDGPWLRVRAGHQGKRRSAAALPCTAQATAPANCACSVPLRRFAAVPQEAIEFFERSGGFQQY